MFFTYPNNRPRRPQLAGELVPRHPSKISEVAQLDWKTWTAIVGAVTGCISLSLQLFSKRPRFYWEALDDPYWTGDRILLKVENPSSRPLIVSRVMVRPRGYGFFPERKEDTTTDTITDVMSQMRTGRIPLALKPGETRSYRVNTIKEGSWAFIIIVWHRHWFLPFRMFAIRRLSHTMVDELSKAAR